MPQRCGDYALATSGFKRSQESRPHIWKVGRGQA